LPDTEILVKMERQLEQVMVSVSNETQEHNTRKLKALVNPEESYVSSLGENQQGIGLGLQLCREYIKQNGGEMHFDIGDGQITISFRLPTFVE
jgi:K+-sensing histidine kinase KdpD